MAESVLRLILETIKRGSGDSEAVRGLQGVVGIYTELNSALSIGRQVLAGVQQAMDATIGETIRYGNQVQDLSRLIGATPEDASKLIQAADDVRVSYETLTAGLQFAIRQGVEPTIAEIGRLADQYVAIGDPIARARFAIETFGRNAGPELARLLELGRAGVEALGEEAQQMGLVLSQDMLNDIEAARQALENFNSAWEGLKTILTVDILPIVTPILTFLKNLILVLRENQEEWGAWGHILGEGVFVLGSAVTAIQRTSSELDSSTGALNRNAAAARTASSAWGTIPRGGLSLVAAAQAAAGFGTIPGGQAGGRLTVPTGFSGDRYPVMVNSGETLDITPTGHAAPGGALTVVVQLASPISLATRREAEEILAPLVAGAIRHELERRAA